MRSNGGHFLERLYVSLRDEVCWKSSRVTCFEGFVWHLHEWPEIKLWINRSCLISLPQCLSHPVLGPVQPGVPSLCFQSPFRKFFSVWIPSALLCLPQLLPCFPHAAAFPGGTLLNILSAKPSLQNLHALGNELHLHTTKHKVGWKQRDTQEHRIIVREMSKANLCWCNCDHGSSWDRVSRREHKRASGMLGIFYFLIQCR